MTEAAVTSATSLPGQAVVRVHCCHFWHDMPPRLAVETYVAPWAQACGVAIECCDELDQADLVLIGPFVPKLSVYQAEEALVGTAYTEVNMPTLDVRRERTNMCCSWTLLLTSPNQACCDSLGPFAADGGFRWGIDLDSSMSMTVFGG